MYLCIWSQRMYCHNTPRVCAFLSALQVRDAINRVRAERKTQRAAQSVTNPQAFAKRKISQATRKRESKRRKMEAVKAVRRGERPAVATSTLASSHAPTASTSATFSALAAGADAPTRPRDAITLKQALKQQKRRRVSEQQ